MQQHSPSLNTDAFLCMMHRTINHFTITALNYTQTGNTKRHSTHFNCKKQAMVLPHPILGNARLLQCALCGSKKPTKHNFSSFSYKHNCAIGGNFAELLCKKGNFPFCVYQVLGESMAGISQHCKTGDVPAFGECVGVASKALCGLTEAAGQVSFQTAPAQWANVVLQPSKIPCTQASSVSLIFFSGLSFFWLIV